MFTVFQFCSSSYCTECFARANVFAKIVLFTRSVRRRSADWRNIFRKRGAQYVVVQLAHGNPPGLSAA